MGTVALVARRETKLSWVLRPSVVLGPWFAARCKRTKDLGLGTDHVRSTKYQVRVLDTLGTRASRSDLEDFAEEKEISEHRAEVAGRIQIVNQLRSDRRLRQHELNGSLRGASVGVNHADERAIGIARLEPEPRDAQGYGIGEAGQRRVALAEEVADLAAGRAALFARKPLRRVRQHELVRFFDGVAA